MKSKGAVNRRELLTWGGAGLASFIAPQFLAPITSNAQTGIETRGRFVVFYFPDGIPGESERGEPNLWNCQGSNRNFALSECLQPLERHREQCVFLNGLTMGATDQGSHPGGAKKLLTAVDGGMGRSIDQHLAFGIGRDAPVRHLYLGVQATVGNPSSDCFISYRDAGQVATPEDDPRIVLQRLFGSPNTSDGNGEIQDLQRGTQEKRLSVLNAVISEVNEVRQTAPPEAQVRLNRQLSALQEVTRQVEALASRESTAESSGGNGSPGSCDAPTLSVNTQGWPTLLDQPESFPEVLQAQSELMALALSCGLTKVGVLQSSRHTSELIMSRFPNAPFSDPQYDMRSHQASHYGASHDRNKREFTDFVAQRVWFVEQYAQFLDLLASYPEGDGSLLDYTLVLLCTEVSDGNTHRHDDMPFVLAGGARLGLNGGQLLQLSGRRHGDLLASICHLLGDPVNGYGQTSSGPIAELWS